MDKREAEQVLRQLNAHHFEANPCPVSEEWLVYARAERDKFIQILHRNGYAVDLQHGDSLEQCGRYFLGERKYPVLQEDGIRSLCPICGKLASYRMPACCDEGHTYVFALHKHLDFCRCGKD